jgi:hypothetical protein
MIQMENKTHRVRHGQSSSLAQFIEQRSTFEPIRLSAKSQQGQSSERMKIGKGPRTCTSKNEFEFGCKTNNDVPVVE